MPFRLRPRDTRLAPALTGLCDAALAAVRLLAESMDPVRDPTVDLVGRATEADTDAEQALHAVLRELDSSLVTPIDRVDAFRLAASVRASSRSVLDVVELVDLLAPVAPTEAIVDQLKYVQLAAEVAAGAVPRFGRHRLLTETWTELGRLRRQSASRHRLSLADLLDGRPAARAVAERSTDGERAPSRPDAATVARLLQVETALQHVMRSFDDVGHLLQAIVVREG